jgi:hypothetical protein
MIKAKKMPLSTAYYVKNQWTMQRLIGERTRIFLIGNVDDEKKQVQ